MAEPGAHTHHSSPPVLDPSLRYHFLGIGGVGMSALAELLHRRGFYISGSDSSEGALLRRLAELGIAVRVEHQAQALDHADVVVYTSALPAEHSIWEAVRKRGLPAWHRSELLGALTAQGRALTVAGTHGKTTCTAATALVLEQAGWDPTALVGGQVPQFGGSTLRYGHSPWLVVEADESDGSFARLKPWAVLLTNIDADHLDQHGSMANIRKAFAAFLERLEDNRTLVYCAEDPHISSLLPSGRWRQCSYGFSAGADVRVEVLAQNREGMRIRLERNARADVLFCALAGRHNALNLAGAFALTTAAGVPETAALAGLAAFRGVKRRQEHRGDAFGCALYDDYAHHPREIAATLEMFSQRFSDPLTVVFQPHLYSRTAHFAEAFAEALRPVARIILLEIYGAREAPREGVGSHLIAAHLRDHGGLTCLRHWREVLPLAQAGKLLPGVLVGMGAGDIDGLAPLLLRARESG